MEIFKQIDANGNGEISQIEFIKALRQDQALAKRLRLPNHIRQEHESRKLFALNYADIDKDQDNVISLPELVATNSGSEMTLSSVLIHCHTRMRVPCLLSLMHGSSLPTVILNT